jgi:hypothetical protein
VSLDRLRRRRNQAEYPDPAGYDPITAEEADEAIQVAGTCIKNAERLREAPPSVLNVLNLNFYRTGR